MRRILYLVTIFALISCSNKIKFEDTQKLYFKDAYFIEWTAGVNGGGSGYNLFFELKQDIQLDKSIQFEGVYFRDKYSKIKSMSSRKFQAFIKSNRNSHEINLEPSNGNDIQNQSLKEKFPFKLNDSQAVLCFIEKNKKKYYKLTLTQKDMQNYPM